MIRLHRSRLAGALAALVLTGLAAAPSAWATTTGTQDATLNARADGDVLTMRLTPVADEGGTAPDLSAATEISASAQDDAGTTYLFDTTKVASAGGTGTSTSLNPTVIIDLDVSGSMKDPVRGKGQSGPKKIDAAKNAITQFLDALPPDYRVGLVEFGDAAKLTVPPGNRADVLTRVQELQSEDDDTLLFQGVTKSLEALTAAKTQQPWLVLLSDGASEGPDVSKTSAEEALAKAGDTGLQFVPIAFGAGADSNRGVLRDLAGAVKGGAPIYEAGDVDELNDVLTGATSAATGALALTAPVPAELRGQVVNLTVTATVDGVRYADVRVVPMDAAPAAGGTAAVPTLQPDPGLATRPVLIAALVALFVAFAAILAIAGGVFTRGGGPESEVMRRLSVYTVNPRDPRRLSLTEQSTQTVGGSPLKRQAVSLLGRILRGREMDAGLDARLDAAGLPLRTAEWMLLHIGVSVGTAFLFLLLGRGALLAGVVGLVIGFAIPWFVLSIRTSRRRNAFLAQLPDTLQALASSLRAGYSLPQAMDAVVQESAPPISTEFSRSLVETRLGMPAEDALDAIADRTASKDFSWIVMAIRIQRQVGGNLAELLTSVAETLRERERLRGQVRALSAEGRLSAWILGLLPVVFTAYLLVAQPDYLKPMLSTPLGLLLMGAGATLVVVGSLWMRKLVSVEV